MQTAKSTEQSADTIHHHRGQLFEAIAAHSLAGIVVVRDDRILYANHAASQIYKQSVEQLMGNGMFEYIHDSDIDRIREYYNQRKSGGQPPNLYEYRIVRDDSEVRWVQSRVCVIDWLGRPAICISQIDITTERASVHELESDRNLLYEVIEQSPDGMCIADANIPNLPIIFANHAFYKITGYTEKDIVGNSCSIIQGPLTSVDTLTELRQCLKNGRRFVGEILNYKKNGEAFWNRLSISPVFNSCGDLTYFISSQVDITETRLSRERIDYLQQALDQLTERISILDNNDRYIYVNHAVEKLVKRSHDDLCGQHISTILADGFYDRYLRDYFQKVRKGKPSARLFDQDELLKESARNSESSAGIRRRFVEYSTSPIKNRDDNVTALVVVSRDKSDEVNTQIALAQGEKRFRDFVDIAADWYWETDLNGKFNFTSPTMDNFLQNLSDPPVSTLEQLMQQSQCDSDMPDFSEIAKTLQPFTQECTFLFNNEEIYMHIKGRPLIVNDNTVAGFRGIASNLTKQRRMEADLREMAARDEPTGLLNRREFQSRFDRALSEDQTPDVLLSLMYIDVDKLKFINDSFGHAAGDELIRRVAEILREVTRGHECNVARIGGDEFVILFSNVRKKEVAELGYKMVEAVDRIYEFEKKLDIRPGLSIGIVHIDSAGTSSDVALAKADIACYQVKQNGGRNVGIYSENDSDYERRMLNNQLQLEIRRALDGDGFEPYLQPIVEILDNRSNIQSFELLLRMRDSKGNLVQPGDFIKAAESYGYIAEIDRWVIRSAIALLVENSAPVSLSINLSGNTLADPSLSHFIVREIESNNIDASCLTFEITETAAIAQIENVVYLIESLSELGCRFLLDDFGSGLSSFKYIQNFKVNGIKIDGSFIQSLSQNKSDPMIVSSMVTLARNLNLDVVAEWVEDEQTLIKLLDLGITRFQGFYFASPEPASDVLHAIRKYHNAEAKGARLPSDARILKHTA